MRFAPGTRAGKAIPMRSLSLDGIIAVIEPDSGRLPLFPVSSAHFLS